MLQPLWESRDRYEELKQLDDAKTEVNAAPHPASSTEAVPPVRHSCPPKEKPHQSNHRMVLPAWDVTECPWPQHLPPHCLPQRGPGSGRGRWKEMLPLGEGKAIAVSQLQATDSHTGQLGPSQGPGRPAQTAAPGPLPLGTTQGPPHQTSSHRRCAPLSPGAPAQPEVSLLCQASSPSGRGWPHPISPWQCPHLYRVFCTAHFSQGPPMSLSLGHPTTHC